VANLFPVPESLDGWYVYMLRCCDGSLYTGIACDLERRVKEHNGVFGGGARYTRSRRPVSLVYQQHLNSRSSALKREIEIKKLNKAQKEALIRQG
jgi:putative endonuclease